jgi:putative SOS response-associated peptidase YedK
MCGRYSTPPGALLEGFFDVPLAYEYVPVYNAAPTQILPIILNDAPDRIVGGRWGLIPFYKREPKPSDGIINARAESLLEGKQSFAREFKERRCLVLADGFYEWKKPAEGAKVPHRIVRVDSNPFAFAGIWRFSKTFDRPTYAIITTTPNQTVAAIHDRMPVMLEHGAEAAWLRGERLEELLHPPPAEATRAFAVSTLVNSPRNDVPEIAEPV